MNELTKKSQKILVPKAALIAYRYDSKRDRLRDRNKKQKTVEMET